MDTAARIPQGRPLCGAVLCGGASRRMGTDKALLVVSGERLVDRAVRRLATVADPVLLACGDRPLAVPGCRAVRDAAPDSGPLAGLVAALRATPHHLMAVVAVDMPCLDPALLRRLAAGWAGEDALVPVGRRGPEPLHAVYARSALAPLEDALAERTLRLRDVLARLSIREVAASDGGEADFAANVNTPADLRAVTGARTEAG